MKVDENGKRLSSGIPACIITTWWWTMAKSTAPEVTELGEILLGEKKGANQMMKLLWSVSAVCQFLDVRLRGMSVTAGEERGTTLNLYLY